MPTLDEMENLANGLVRKIDGLSVVLPALNEEACINSTVSEFKRILAASGVPHYEVIVVDDGSRDDTGKIAHESGARVLRHPTNGGYGRSLKDGIAAAQYDTIVIADADGTYPIHQLSLLLSSYEKGFDMVVGARTGVHYRQSWAKKLLRTLLQALVEFASGKKIADINSGFRVFSRKKAMPLYNHLCDTMSFTTSITLAYFMTGCYIEYVPTEYNKRVGRSHVKLIRDAARTLLYIIQQILYFNPMKIFMLFSTVCLLLSGLGFLVSMYLGLNVGYIVGNLAFISSIIVFAMGMIAEQLRQTDSHSTTDVRRT